jgi:hypothetical protein
MVLGLHSFERCGWHESIGMVLAALVIKDGQMPHQL